MRLRFLSVVMTLLAGCVPWQPLGTSYQPQSGRNYDKDLYECEREATLAGTHDKQRIFDACMKARGYKER